MFIRPALVLAASLISSALAAPTSYTPYMVKRDEVSDAITSAIPISNTYGESLANIVEIVLADPLLQLRPYYDTSKSGTYNIPAELSKAVTTAVQGIENLPTLPTSDNPSEDVVAAYGPLVIVVSRSLFYTLIDLKLLSSTILNPIVPGYRDFVNGIDNGSYQFVKGLDAEFKGFSSALAKEIGEDTPLGIAIKELGGELFHLLFDHI